MLLQDFTIKKSTAMQKVVSLIIIFYWCTAINLIIWNWWEKIKCKFMISWSNTQAFQYTYKKNLMVRFYEWDWTASMLQSHYDEAVYFSPLSSRKIPCTHLIDLGRIKDWVDLGATQWFWTREPWIRNPVP